MRYITMRGFLIAFILGGVATIAACAPAALDITTSGGIRGSMPQWGFGLVPMFARFFSSAPYLHTCRILRVEGGQSIS